MCEFSGNYSADLQSRALNSQHVNTISSLNREFLRTLNHFSRVVNLFSPCDRDTIFVFLLPSPDRAFLIGARLCRKDVSVLLSGFCSSDKLRPPDRGQFINIHKPVSVDEQKFRVDYRSFFHPGQPSVTRLVARPAAPNLYLRASHSTFFSVSDPGIPMSRQRPGGAEVISFPDTRALNINTRGPTPRHAAGWWSVRPSASAGSSS